MLVLRNGDCPSRVLITKLISDRNIRLKSEVNAFVRSWGDEALNSSEWLLAYEILVNRWHNLYASINLPDNRELFEYMRDNRISFIDDAEVERVDLPHVFKKYLAVDETKEGTDDNDWADIFEDDEVEGETSEDDEVDITSDSD
ncbi:MAG: hypothetical protein CMN78_04245 [Spirochaetales bacterium]|nr:hypothetical protein [Spirochaetales bacterium]